MYMDCNNLNLGELKPNTYPVNESRIKDLLLQHTGLRRLEYNVFNNLTRLLSLDLSDNFLSSLDYRLFIKNTQLKSLNLRNNKLTILDDGRIFKFQKNLISLVLDFNLLKYVNVSVLNPLVSLKSIFLLGNRLVCNCELRQTMLWCEAKKLDSGAVCESPVKYSNSSWSALNQEDCNKTKNVTKVVLDSRCHYDSDLESLDCKDVPLRIISARSFPKNLSLESLVLQNTSLSVLEDNLFDSMSSLKYLDLSSNFLENLGSRLFSKLNELKTLDLSNNKFLSLAPLLLNAQKLLKTLKLNNNHLGHLDKESLSPLISLEHLNLSNNRFTCDCELSDVMMWCAGRNLSTGATCVFPKPLSGMSWTVLQNDTNCIKPTTPVYIPLSPMATDHERFNIIMLVVIIAISILLLLSVIGALWYLRAWKKPDESMMYDDICLDVRIDHTYESMEDTREHNFDNATICKPTNSSQFNHHDALTDTENAANENTYESIETLKMRDKKSISHEASRDVASYMDMSGARKGPREENIYVLK